MDRHRFAPDLFVTTHAKRGEFNQRQGNASRTATDHTSPLGTRRSAGVERWGRLEVVSDCFHCVAMARSLWCEFPDREHLHRTVLVVFCAAVVSKPIRSLYQRPRRTARYFLSISPVNSGPLLRGTVGQRDLPSVARRFCKLPRNAPLRSCDRMTIGPTPNANAHRTEVFCNNQHREVISLIDTLQHAALIPFRARMLHAAECRRTGPSVVR